MPKDRLADAAVERARADERIAEAARGDRAEGRLADAVERGLAPLSASPWPLGASVPKIDWQMQSNAGSRR